MDKEELKQAISDMPCKHGLYLVDKGDLYAVIDRIFVSELSPDLKVGGEIVVLDIRDYTPAISGEFSFVPPMKKYIGQKHIIEKINPIGRITLKGVGENEKHRWNFAPEWLAKVYPQPVPARPEPRFEVGMTVRHKDSGYIFSIAGRFYMDGIWFFESKDKGDFSQHCLEPYTFGFGDEVHHEKKGYGFFCDYYSDGMVATRFKKAFMVVNPIELEFISKSQIPEDTK
jgi:hypothetical protein